MEKGGVQDAQEELRDQEGLQWRKTTDYRVGEPIDLTTQILGLER
jgi:hypothetical protein